MSEIKPTEERGKRTGRKLIVLTPQSTRASVASALADTGAQMVTASDYGGAVPADVMAAADTVMLDGINVMIVSGASTRAVNAVSTLEAQGQVQSVEDEDFVYADVAPDAPRALRDYLEGYRAGVDALVDRLSTGAHPVKGTEGWDETQMTWGLQAVGVDRTLLSGRGVKVAILDTGIDLTHPDFKDRSIVSKSFVPKEEVQDEHGHGTHTAGTACGPKDPAHPPRYGVAYEADLYIGKVLSNAGSGNDGWVLNGINWALTQGCRVISMSLGSRHDTPKEAFRAAGQRALENNAIIIASTGNASRRNESQVVPTGSPANAPTIFAVSAVDEDLAIANFSSAGKVEITAPGVHVISAGLTPRLAAVKSGTSMAAPHVSGVAALLMQADPSASAQSIWDRLRAKASPLEAPVSDVGAGLVQAPGGEEAGAVAEAQAPPPASTRPSRVRLVAGFAVLPAHPSQPGATSGVTWDVIVIVKDGYDLDGVADDLRQAGMYVPPDGIQRILRTITGSALPSVLDAIRVVTGVLAVEKAGFVDIGPPEPSAP